jgi:2-oxoisovalerate dehydrogenase E2 component (dihydrolipoyl transacylase)
MGQYAIRMPDIGEGIAEVELVAWRVQPGESVAEDQVLADVMTDKATVEIPSPIAGKVLTLGGVPGERMAVGAELIRLEVEGTGNLGSDSLPLRGRAGVGAPASEPQVRPERAPERPHPNPPPEGEGEKSRPEPPALGEADRPIASPSVRRRAWELGIDLRTVRASGPGGRIMHADLEAHGTQRGAAPVASAPAFQPREGEQAIPVIGLRRRIAQRMQEAKRRIPHFTYVEEVDVTELESVRRQLNSRYGDVRGKLTLLPFIARALVLALLDFPQLNARFDDEAGIVTRHAAVHLGIATQTDAGLLVPVLRHAETQDLWACGREIARLAEAARGGRITRDQLSGSTLTLTSLGALGGIVSTPVINLPEVAIVGVNRIVERAVLQEGRVVARQLMNLSSSFDHRVVDGADAARFIQAVRSLLEQPALLLA